MWQWPTERGRAMSSLLNELLALDDKALLWHKAVVEAAEGLGLDVATWYSDNQISGCLDMQYKSLADVAFEMRDACTDKGQGDHVTWAKHLYTVMNPPIGVPFFVEAAAEPKHWIIAAVMAWEASEKATAQRRLKEAGIVDESGKLNEIYDPQAKE